MNPFDHTEEDAIKTLLEETAGQIKPSSAFTANLERQLKQAHKPKAGLNMLTLKKVAAPVGWGLALIALAFAFNWIASQIAPKNNIPASSNPDFICPVTPPNGSLPPGETVEDINYLGNDELWTRLWLDGKIYMTRNDQISDGSFNIKWPWWHTGEGTLSIEGHRLDSETGTVGVKITEGRPGYQVSTLTFPTSGCWELTGQVGDSSLTFVTEIMFDQPTPQPAPFSEGTPVPSTPTGEVYQWNGQSVYLNAALPEVSPEMKIFLAQDEVSASIQDVQTLAEKFGMQGEIYEVQGEIPDTKDYLMVDGNQQLRIRSDRYFTYYPNYAESMYAFDTKENPNAEAMITEFMQAHGFDMNYKLERSGYFGGYFVMPLTPDGFSIHHEQFTVNGFVFEFNESGIVRVRSSLLKYDEVATLEIISAEEALNKLLVDTGLSYGVLSGMHSAAKETSSWIRTRPLDQTFTYYAVLSSTGKSITGGAPLITLDGYMVTGNVQNIPENMPNTFVKATGQFHESNGVKTFELESWTDYTGYEEGYVGTILQEGNQTFFISAEGNKLKIEDVPADLPLPAENIFTTGVTHDGEFDWKSIDDRATSGGGGGGGGSSGFYQLNLSGTPMPLPTVVPQQTPTLGVHQFEKQRGLLGVMVTHQTGGSELIQYWLSSSDPDYPYVLLEGENLESLQNYHNRPVEIWGAMDRFDEVGNVVVKVDRFEIPFPDLQFQILKGTQETAQVNGETVLLFRAESGVTYVQFDSTSGPSSPDYSLLGVEGDPLAVEALIIPDESFGGYAVLRVFSGGVITGANGEEVTEFPITADQPNIVDDSIFSPFNPPTLNIEKVELIYFTPDMRYYPSPDPNHEPPYLQPAWRFSGHYSEGSEFEFIVQALKDEFLSPEVQAVRPPG